VNDTFYNTNGLWEGHAIVFYNPPIRVQPVHTDQLV